jgi:hypothetical protein
MFDVILAAVTLASMALAGVMGIVTWRTLSRERRRFDERVEELSSAAADPAESAPGLFAEPSPVSSNGRRFIVAAAFGSAVLVLAFAAVMALNPVSTGRTGVPPAAARVAAPIELVSLDHVRGGRGLSIHGRLRNPVGGAALRDLVAVVFLFNDSGEQVGTTQAAVTATVLAPGGETLFDVPVGDGLRVARYRVTFRVAEGTPVPHVDRRMTPRSATPGPMRVAAERSVVLATPPAR